MDERILRITHGAGLMVGGKSISSLSVNRVTFLFLFLVSYSYGQETVTVYGIVTDLENKPIYGVKVTNPQGEQTTLTDKNGLFAISIVAKETKIDFDHLSMISAQKDITTKDIKKAKNDTVRLFIQMAPKIEELPTVDIVAQEKRLAYDSQLATIIDFEFSKTNMLLLLKENGDYKLRMINRKGEDVDEVILDQRPGALQRDCFGNVHVMCRDSVYQINASNMAVDLLYAFDREKFQKMVASCVAEGQRNLYYQAYGPHGQQIEYIRIEKESQKQSVLHEIKDPVRERAVRDLYNSAQKYSRMYPHAAANRWKRSNQWTLENQGVLDMRDAEEQSMLYETVFNKPVYAPLFRIQDTVYIFDHVTDILTLYSSRGEQIRTAEIKYHYGNGWKSEIIQDYSTSSLYGRFDNGGICSLQAIDISSGFVNVNYRIEDHAFPLRLKIRNGIAYYIQLNPTNDGVYSVYRQRLSE